MKRQIETYLHLLEICNYLYLYNIIALSDAESNKTDKLTKKHSEIIRELQQTQIRIDSHLNFEISRYLKFYRMASV